MNNDLSFCSELDDLLKNGKTTGKSGREFDDLAAASTENNLVTLRNLALDVAPKRTLEIGFAFGASALVFAATHRDLGHDPCSQHLAIDPYQHSVWDDTGKMVMKRARLQAYLEHRSGLSSQVLPELITEEKSFGVIYVDGSHLFEDVFIDFYYSVRLLEPGGGDSV